MRPVALLPILSIAACGPAISSAAFTQAAPKPPEHEIRVYSTRQPTCEYEELGLIRGKERTFSNLQDVVTAMKERAREMGGDAIIGMGRSQTVQGNSVNDVVSLESQDVLIGTVIRFKQSDCRS